MKSKPKKSKNTGLGFLFIFAVLVIFGLAFILKGVSVYQKSTFDGKTNYNILLKNDAGISILSIKPSSHSLNIIQYKGNSGQFSKLGIPVDAIISKNVNIHEDDVRSKAMSLLIGSINPIDALRIYIYINTTSANSVKSVSLSSQDSSRTLEIFSDPSLSSEKMTIQLVNGTGEQGIGALLAHIISNMGGNIILVSTQNKPQEDSQIISDNNKGETFKKLQKMLDLEWKKDEKAEISDIKIIIGKDFLRRL